MPQGPTPREPQAPARWQRGAGGCPSWTGDKKCLGFLDLDPLRVGVLSERHEFLEILARSCGVAGSFRRLRRTVKQEVACSRRHPVPGYGLSTQNRKNSGRSSVSFGLVRHRTRGEEPARGCCCGGGDEEAQPTVRTSSARTRRARVTAGYDTSRPMPRDFARLSPRAAVERLLPGMKVLLPPPCGEPVTLLPEACPQARRLRERTLVGG